jgi:hypothetical protein
LAALDACDVAPGRELTTAAAALAAEDPERAP